MWTRIGLQRRIQALECRGWSNSDIMRDTYLSALSVREMSRGEAVSVEKAALLVAFYDANSLKLGSSSRAFNRAQAGRYVPAEAWTALTIDLPDAQPDWSRVPANFLAGRPWPREEKATSQEAEVADWLSRVQFGAAWRLLPESYRSVVEISCFHSVGVVPRAYRGPLIARTIRALMWSDRLYAPEWPSGLGKYMGVKSQSSGFRRDGELVEIEGRRDDRTWGARVWLLQLVRTDAWRELDRRDREMVIGRYLNGSLEPVTWAVLAQKHGVTSGAVESIVRRTMRYLMWRTRDHPDYWIAEHGFFMDMLMPDTFINIMPTPVR
jgi:hypothetical protein